MTALKRPASGFSMIEVLVTALLISILSILLFLGMSLMRERGYQIACAAQMRQIGMGLILYAADNKNCLPPAQTSLDNEEASKTEADMETSWGAAVWPYLEFGFSKENNDHTYRFDKAKSDFRLYKNQNIFRCPSTMRKPTYVQGVMYEGTFKPCSYSLNTQPLMTLFPDVINLGNHDDCRVGLNRSFIKNAPTTAMVMEHGLHSTCPIDYFKSTGLIPHRGGSNVLFHDGHLEYRKLKDIPGYLKPADYNNTFWTGQ
jgi:prepilin-type processing-associated H-X9-DG protein